MCCTLHDLLCRESGKDSFFFPCFFSEQGRKEGRYLELAFDRSGGVGFSIINATIAATRGGAVAP